MQTSCMVRCPEPVRNQTGHRVETVRKRTGDGTEREKISTGSGSRSEQKPSPAQTGKLQFPLRIESGSLYFVRIRRRNNPPIPAVTGSRNSRDQDLTENELSAVCITDRSAILTDFLSGRERSAPDRQRDQLKNAKKDERKDERS